MNIEYLLRLVRSAYFLTTISSFGLSSMAWISFGRGFDEEVFDGRRVYKLFDDDKQDCSDEEAVNKGHDMSRFKRFQRAQWRGPGLPLKQLPKPGIDCVNGDRPCLPCDIVNIRLRVAVAGERVKKAVAECQKRYFCRVWNLLFSYLFPDIHQTARSCSNLKSNDPAAKCRSFRSSDRRRNEKQFPDLTAKSQKGAGSVDWAKKRANIRYNLTDSTHMKAGNLAKNKIAAASNSGLK